MYAPRPARTTTSASVDQRPRVFIGYRLRHHEYTPDAKMKPGMMTIDSQLMLACCVAVSVTRRSSGSFARIEIRFSCCESQPTMFMNRSRLPWMPSAEFDAKSESPMTATRVSGFGASGAAFASVAVDATLTAQPMSTGPFLSPLLSSSETWPDVSRLLMSFSAQLRALVSTNACAVRPLTPPATGVHDRDIGNAVRKLNVPFFVIACDG